MVKNVFKSPGCSPSLDRNGGHHSFPTVRKEYMMTLNQIKREEHIERVFQQIDYNKSGSIEVGELNMMFTYYGIEISR